jgi:hypothetical protein
MPRILPDDYDLTFAVELWFPNDSGVEQTLARCARQTHAYILFDRIKAEYPNRILRIRQKSRVIQELIPE